jgi:hypothetical protein
MNVHLSIPVSRQGESARGFVQPIVLFEQFAFAFIANFQIAVLNRVDK